MKINTEFTPDYKVKKARCPRIMRYAVDLCKEKRTAIDIGAYIGVCTKYFAKYFNKVIAFEPSIESYNKLVKSCKNLDNVVISITALGTEASTGKIIRNKISNQNRVEVCRPEEAEIIIAALDDYLEDSLIKDVDLIKCDAQGFDYFCLLGAKDTIVKYRPIIIIEEDWELPRLYGIGIYSASNLLLDWGYKPRYCINKDIVFIP